ncbi:MAG: hypothetical protein ABMB14_28200, partial [Myxococcota bacterium]
MAELAVRTLACPACGGQMSAPDRGVARCGFCAAQVLVYESGVRKVGVYTVAPTTTAEAARATVEAKLRRSGFEQVPPLAASEGSLRYLVRRGRIRVTQGAVGKVREGWFGVPWGGGPGAVVVFDSPEHLVAVADDVPPGLASEVLGFEDAFQQRYERDVRLRTGQERTRLEHAAWTDELFVVDVPVLTFAFDAPKLPTTLTRMWYDTAADGRYAASVDLADGQLLVFRAPWRGPNLWTGVGCFVIAVTLPGLIGTCVGLAGAAVGAGAGLLGAIVGVLAPLFA